MSTIQGKIFEMLLGYRDLMCLGKLIDQKRPNDLKTISSIWPEFDAELVNLSHYIKYQLFCLKIWLSTIDDVLEGRPGLIHSHADLPLEDYVLGILQRNILVWKNWYMKGVLDFAKDKVVLDFGFGGMFYASHFVEIAKETYGIEKEDVEDFVRKNIIIPPNFTILKDTSSLDDRIDVVFFGEILHGKSANAIDMELMPMLRDVLKDDGIVVICELKEGTPLSRLFDLHMKIHGKVGALTRKQEILDVMEFQEIVFQKEFDYHYMIGGRLW